jgi:hypothetical protein
MSCPDEVALVDGFGEESVDADEPGRPGRVQPLAGSSPAVLPAALIADLVGMADDGRTPLVVYSGGIRSPAVRARTVVALTARDIGMQVVLVLEAGDASKPIILGVLRKDPGWPGGPGERVEVEADGERLTVTAKARLVLRCGKASLTLTKSGKVLLQGTYVSSCSSGVNRIEGGSVQIN